MCGGCFALVALTPYPLYHIMASLVADRCHETRRRRHRHRHQGTDTRIGPNCRQSQSHNYVRRVEYLFPRFVTSSGTHWIREKLISLSETIFYLDFPAFFNKHHNKIWIHTKQISFSNATRHKNKRTLPSAQSSLYKGALNKWAFVSRCCSRSLSMLAEWIFFLRAKMQTQ